MKFKFVSLIFILFPIASEQRSNSKSLSYVGAVVEYSPVFEHVDGIHPSDLNAENYLKIIDKASKYDVDILVFPEDGLSVPTSKNPEISRSEDASYVPEPDDNIIPCDDDSETYKYSLKSISCAARKHKIYVVINHKEKVDCTGKDCPGDGVLVYNTNVVFDREGQVISKYRKYNLFGEYEMNRTSVPIPTTFETDFGVTFGTIICFDILFETPTVNLTRDLGMTDIIFTAHWYSELPFPYPVELQAGWAQANDVNLLASGQSFPATGSSGSGIYMGKQGYAQVILENKKSNILLVSEIPKVINGKRTQGIDQNKVHTYVFNKSEISTSESVGSGIYVYRDENLHPYTTELIDFKQDTHIRFLCNRGFCCKFNLKTSIDNSIIKNDSKYYQYRLAVFNGVRDFIDAEFGLVITTTGLKVCGILSCINNTIDGCGQLFQQDNKFIEPTSFESIDISTGIIKDQRTFYMPITLMSNMKPMNTSDVTFTSTDPKGKSKYSMSLNKPINRLLTFAIYGRDFEKDGLKATE